MLCAEVAKVRIEVAVNAGADLNARDCGAKADVEVVPIAGSSTSTVVVSAQGVSKSAVSEMYAQVHVYGVTVTS